MNANDRLDAIEARANAATEGPWQPSHDAPTNTRPDWTYDVLDNGGEEVISSGLHADTVFIAHARQDVPALVNALRAALKLAQDGRLFMHNVHPIALERAITAALDGAS